MTDRPTKPDEAPAALPTGSTEEWGFRPPGEPLPDAAVLEPCGGFWVFGYGSLMWNPGFAAAARRPAVLPGYRRSFCLWSVHYRGTRERPGLVVALDEDPKAETRGVAFWVEAAAAPATRAYLAERELISGSYFETVAPMRLLSPDGAAPAEEARTLTYVIDRGHEQYAGDLTLEQQAAVIAESVGPLGPNDEYLHNTVAQLKAEGLSDAELGDLGVLEALVRARRAERLKPS
ncbi:MAG: gamma-glutamylcyclotransferase [Pseudomonadota bacterium]